MDIKRPDQTKAKRKKRILMGAGALVVVAGITILLARLKPAAPTVERNLVWIQAVQRGPMLRAYRAGLAVRERLLDGTQGDQVDDNRNGGRTNETGTPRPQDGDPDDTQGKHDPPPQASGTGPKRR